MNPVKEPVHPPLTADTDLEVRSMDSICINESHLKHPFWYNLKYFVTGIWFGIILTKSQVISWFRIQEMFHLQRFHMYGVIGSAIGVGALSIFLIKKFHIRTIYGEPIHFVQTKFSKGQIWGGLIFGLGWALTGACPGPLFALIGTGAGVILVTFLSAVAGTWVYGLIRDRLPH